MSAQLSSNGVEVNFRRRVAPVISRRRDRGSCFLAGARPDWRRLEPLLPRSTTGRPRADDHQFINGALWIDCTGAPWRDLPEQYGERSSVWSTSSGKSAGSPPVTRSTQRTTSRCFTLAPSYCGCRALLLGTLQAGMIPSRLSRSLSHQMVGIARVTIQVFPITWPSRKASGGGGAGAGRAALPTR